MNLFHTPVLLNEVIEALRIQKGKKYIDATVGGGGHAKEIVGLGGIVLGIDTDSEAIEKNKQNPWKVVHGNFKDIEKIAEKEKFVGVDGILFDLGVSSHQLNTPERGFSYRFTNAPLDLRLDQSQGETAAQLVNRLSTEELYDIFARFGEEELARPIAHAIFRARRLNSIVTTGDLAKAIGNKPDVLSRIFQALRIKVNDELNSLRIGLKGARTLLGNNGRLVVLSFHSLEDRIVKQTMLQENYKIITRKPITASREEIFSNPRSRSAKMRIGEAL